MVTIRVGEAITGVACADVGTEVLVRSRFAAFVDDRPLRTSALHVDLGSGTRPGNLRSVPHIRSGRRWLARDRSPDAVLDALDGVLGSMRAADAASSTRRDGAWLPLRVMVDARGGDRAAVLGVSAPALMGDRVLADHSIFEIATWLVPIGSDGSITVPVRLSGVSAQRVVRVGSVVGVGVSDGPADVFAALARHHASSAWFRLLGSVPADRRVVAPDWRVARAALIDIVDADGSTPVEHNVAR